jgi:hypothetical protein
MITNYLSPSSFVISISRLPNVEFFTQKVMIPSVTGSSVEVNNPVAFYYASQDRLRYAELDLSFIIDENMNNYTEILRWMEGLGTPETTNQYKTIKSSQDGLSSDITIIINNSHKNPNIKFTFKNCFPVGLTPISLDITQQDITYIEATATFRYDTFTMERYST